MANRFSIGDVTYWRFGDHYYRHTDGKTKRITQKEYEQARNIQKCKSCGSEYYSVKEEFKCTKCGYVNRKESEADG